jgi:hypothetical protein
MRIVLFVVSIVLVSIPGIVWFQCGRWLGIFPAAASAPDSEVPWQKK